MAVKPTSPREKVITKILGFNLSMPIKLRKKTSNQAESRGYQSCSIVSDSRCRCY